jgi:hypothetical protein
MENYALEKLISQVKTKDGYNYNNINPEFELCYNKISISGVRGQIIATIKCQFPSINDLESKSHRKKRFRDEIAKNEIYIGYGEFEMDNEFGSEKVSYKNLRKEIFEVGGDNMSKKVRREKTAHKIIGTVHDLANDNFDESDKFVTFVFAEVCLDLKVANNYFDNFIHRLSYYLKTYKNYDKPIKYLFGIHFKQENRECIHYHGLWDLPYIPQKELLQIWGRGSGSVWISKARKIRDVGDYLYKYMSGAVFDERFIGNKAYLCSKGLERRIYKPISDENLEKFMKEKDITIKQRTDRAKFNTEFYGWIEKTTYNLEKGR